MFVPEDVGSDCIQPHGARHAKTVAPILAGNSRIVHFTRDDLERFPIEGKMIAFHSEGMLRVKAERRTRQASDDLNKRSDFQTIDLPLLPEVAIRRSRTWDALER